MTSLVYGIYDISRRNTYIMTVDSKETAHELCLLEDNYAFKPIIVLEDNYAFKPIIVATSVSEAKVLIRNNSDVDD